MTEPSWDTQNPALEPRPAGVPAAPAWQEQDNSQSPFELQAAKEAEEPKPRVIVRVRTTAWHDRGGMHLKRDITYLKRKSTGFNFLEEECAQIGADEVFPRIENLNECKDGIYEMILCNITKDWETGHVDDYDFRLISCNCQSEP